MLFLRCTEARRGIRLVVALCSRSTSTRAHSWTPRVKCSALLPVFQLFAVKPPLSRSTSSYLGQLWEETCHVMKFNYPAEAKMPDPRSLDVLGREARSFNPELSLAKAPSRGRLP